MKLVSLETSWLLLCNSWTKVKHVVSQFPNWKESCIQAWNFHCQQGLKNGMPEISLCSQPPAVHTHVMHHLQPLHTGPNTVMLSQVCLFPTVGKQRSHHMRPYFFLPCENNMFWRLGQGKRKRKDKQAVILLKILVEFWWREIASCSSPSACTWSFLQDGITVSPTAFSVACQHHLHQQLGLVLWSLSPQTRPVCVYSPCHGYCLQLLESEI